MRTARDICTGKPIKRPNGYAVTVYTQNGAPVVSCLPRASRNDAVVRAWTLANDMRAGRV
jgi:hypothetical protein